MKYIPILSEHNFYFSLHPKGYPLVNGKPLDYIQWAAIRTTLRDIGFKAFSGLKDEIVVQAYVNTYGCLPSEGKRHDN